MKDRWYGWTGRSWETRVVWACAGFVFLAILLCDPSRKPSEASPGSGTNQFLLVSNNLPWTKRAMPWYLRSGQWRADMRSLAAVLRYLTDSEDTASATQTNLMPAKADNA